MVDDGQVSKAVPLGAADPPPRRHTDAPTVVLHWLVALLLLVSLATGALIAAAAGYVVFLRRSRLARRVAFDASRMRALRSPSRRRRWQSINVLIHWLAFVLVLAAAGTGTLMYVGSTIASQPVVAALHRGIAWGLIGYVGLHVAGHMLMA